MEETKQNPNQTMEDILKNATTGTSNKSYEEIDKKETTTPNKKEKVGAGRKKVADKKKPINLFYNNAEFKEIEEVAEMLCVEPKTFMMMAIKSKIKELKKKEEDQ